jgi:predicted alpha/beta superfamily hydrolase
MNPLMRYRPMPTMRAVFHLLFSSFAVSGLPSGATAQQPSEATAQPLTLLLGRRHVVRSKINGQTYNVSVVLPVGYDTLTQRAAATRYPTLYVLDGEWMLFGRFTRAGYPVSPNVIVVGIASATEHPQRRSFDYTPRDDSSAWAKRALQGGVPFGGADAFLRVLKEEIIPLVDRTYRTTSDRGIHGHSMGGLFVAYAMLEAPDLFTRYAMTSPSLWWNERMIITREPEFAKQHPVFPKHIFVSIGSEEDSAMAAVMYQFARRLCGSFSKGYYKGLELIVESIPGEEHQSPVPHWRAMRALYPADTTGLDPSIPRKPKRPGELRYCEP